VTTVFLGTSEFAADVLTRLAASEHRPALVLTRPDRPRGRGRRLTRPPVAERARALGLELAQPDSVNSEHARELIAAAGGAGDAAEAGRDRGGRKTVVVCAFGALIKEPLLSEHDLINVHPSLLPRWRGAAPMERALLAGDERTGVSIMRLTAGLDSGPVCAQEPEPIRPDDTFGSLSARLAERAGSLLVAVLEDPPDYVEQPETGITYADKIEPSDRVLVPTAPAVEAERRVRALNPHIGARVALADGTMLGVQRAAVAADAAADADSAAEAAAGADADAGALGVHASDGRLLLHCRPGTLELLTVKPPGGRAMDAAAYLRGHALGRR
jgi:methionyl-tRNA formyltransferase